MSNTLISRNLSLVCLIAGCFSAPAVSADWSGNRQSNSYNPGYGDFAPKDIEQRLFGHLNKDDEQDKKSETVAQNSPQATRQPSSQVAVNPPPNQQLQNNQNRNYPAQGSYNQNNRYPQNGYQRNNRNNSTSFSSPWNNRGGSFSGPWNSNGSNFSGPWNNSGSGFNGPWNNNNNNGRNNNGSGFSMPWGNNNGSNSSPWGGGWGW